MYGLNFSSKEDADAFARAMLHALEVILLLKNYSRFYFQFYLKCKFCVCFTYQVLASGIINRNPAPPPAPTQQYAQSNGQYDDDMGGYRCGII